MKISDKKWEIPTDDLVWGQPPPAPPYSYATGIDDEEVLRKRAII